MEPSRRRVCALLAGIPAAGLSGCLSDGGADVGLGEVAVGNFEERPHTGRIWLTLPSGGSLLATPTAETVWESTYDLDANDPDDVRVPAAAYNDELPEDVAPYRLHIDPDDGPKKSWDLSEEFGSDNDCVQATIELDPEYPSSLFVSGGCDTIPE